MTLQSSHSSTGRVAKFTIESSDVLSDSRIFVKEEGTGKIVWFKERFLTDDEIIENVVLHASSTLCWTIHKPIRGWYLRLSAPGMRKFISLIPPPARSPYHVESGLTFECRTLDAAHIATSPDGLVKADKDIDAAPADKPSTDAESSSSRSSSSSDATVVHSYPPTPISESAPPLSPRSVKAKLDKLESVSERLAQGRQAEAQIKMTRFLLSPHSGHISQNQQPQQPSFLSRAVSFFKSHQSAQTLSFTLCPVREDIPADQTASASGTSRHEHAAGSGGAAHSHLAPPLLTFHDTTPVFTFGSSKGVLEIDESIEATFGMERSFWIAIALAYLEFSEDRESYLAAANG